MADRSGDFVRAQYEAYPYPARDPGDESRRLICGSPSHLDEIRHYLFAGRLDLTRRFRVLIAGGGTGDAAIMLAQQLADAGATDAEVTYLDLSEASRAIAESRARARGLKNLKFLTGPIEQASALASGPFDYVDCCGVLHHLASPEAGLAALAGTLAPGGGMGIMVYGTLGRAGVYPVQEAMRQLADDLPDRDRVRLVRRLVDGLPASHWLKRNPFVGDHLGGDDSGLYDLLLHRRDRSYLVGELAALLDSAGLAPAAWIEPARYNPETYCRDPELRRLAAGLGTLERVALAERLSSVMAKHIVYARQRGQRAPDPADPGDPGAVLVLRDLDPVTIGRGLKPGGTLSAELDGTAYRAPLPSLAPALTVRIDGVRSNREVRAALVEDGIAAPGPDGLADQIRILFRAFNGINRMLVRTAGTAAEPQ